MQLEPNLSLSCFPEAIGIHCFLSAKQIQSKSFADYIKKLLVMPQSSSHYHKHNKTQSYEIWNIFV